MSLVGNLEDLPLADILQIVSLSKRTGILTIETEEGKSIVVFKNGLIVSTACPSPQIKNLGQTLMEKYHLTREQLNQVLELQKSKGNQPLGSILLQEGLIDTETLQQIIKTQIKSTIYFLMNQPEGNFSFDLSEVIPFDDIRYNPMETVLEGGLNPQQLLLDSARISDEQKLKEDQESADTFVASELLVPDTEKEPEEKTVETYDELDDLRRDVLESVTLDDLQLPETSELPDLPFDRIAEQINFTVPVPPVVVTPVPPSAYRTAKRTILLVDDETLIRQIMAKRLEERGFHVVQSDHPTDAIAKAEELLQAEASLWVISDLVMPTTVGHGFLGGLEVMEAIRRVNPSVPIIVMTDYEDPKAQTRAFSLGVHQFQSKPMLAKSTVSDAEAQLAQFADELIEEFRQPPHQFDPSQVTDDFWSDLGFDTIMTKQPAMSATHMVRQMTALREIIQQLQNPNEAPEISLLILRYASEFFDRGILFLVKKDEVNGLGGFGDTGEKESMPAKVRRIKASLAEDSIFSRVMVKKTTHVGKLADVPANRRFVGMTGSIVPPAIAMLPLISGNEVIALLYGDNAISRKPIRDLEGLEIFMVQAGIAMENALLHRKIRSLKFK